MRSGKNPASHFIHPKTFQIMELPLQTIRELDEFVCKADEENDLTDRELAIREAARFFICLTHEERYNEIDGSAKCYRAIIDTLCRL